MTGGTVPLTIGGEQLLLHPERAALWPRRRTVIVADTHFGKTSFFGRHGIAVPAGSDDADRGRLRGLVRESGAERIIVLGDFVHAPIAADSREALDIEAWTRDLAPARVVVIAGNHDRGTPRGCASSIVWHDGEWLEPPFRFMHEAVERAAHDEFFTLSGHVHPVARLKGLRRQSLRVPVFWQRRGGLVLPSFGSFTGGFAVRPAAGERLFAVGPTAVAPIAR